MSEDFLPKNQDIYNKVNEILHKKTGKPGKTKIPQKINSIMNGFNRINNNGISGNPENTPQTHINPDGSGTKVIQTFDKNGNSVLEVVTLGAGGKVLNKNKKVRNKNGNLISTSSTIYKYDKNGKLKNNIQINENAKDKTKIVNTFNSDGKISHTQKKVKLKNNGKPLTYESQADYHYTNGKLTSKEVTGTDQSGNPYSYLETYKSDGKTIKSHSKSFYKRGALHKDYYEGENLKNRIQGGLPNTRIVYEDDGKTIKETIKNDFDENGVLIGREKYDSNGKLIDKKDFSKVDGNFDTAYQIGKGDCYLLASINALSQTEEGQRILKENVKVSVNENGEKVYTISLPGAEKARQALINGTGEVKIHRLPEDKVHIQGSYTITESELEEASKRAGKDYSAGDKDVLLYEIAYEKYRDDVADTIKDNKLDPKKTSYIAGLGISQNFNNDTLSGGYAAEATFILTGKQSDLYNNNRKVPTCYIDSDMNMHIADNNGNINIGDEKAMSVVTNNNHRTPMDEMLGNLREDSKDGKIDNYAATAGFNVSSQEVNGKVISGGGHALTIVKVTDNEVILSNPWDPDTPISMTIEDFKKSATSISYIELNSQQAPQNSQNLGSKIEAAFSRLQSNQNHPTRPTRIPQRQNLNAFINQYFNRNSTELSEDKIQKLQDAIKRLNTGSIKADNGELYIEAGTELNLPDFDEI